MNSFKRYLMILLVILQAALLLGCEDSDIYQLKQNDISLSVSQLSVVQYEIINVVVTSVSDDGVTYLWTIGEQIISTSKNLFHTFLSEGSFILILTAIQEDLGISHQYEVAVEVSAAPYHLEEDDVMI